MMSFEAAQALSNVVPHTAVVRADNSGRFFILVHQDRSPATVDRLIDQLCANLPEDVRYQEFTTDTDADRDDNDSYTGGYYSNACAQDHAHIYDDWSDDSNTDWSVSFDDRGPGDWEDLIDDPNESDQVPSWCDIDISESWANPLFGLYDKGCYRT